MKNNLIKLLSKGIDPNAMQYILTTIFTTVTTKRRQEMPPSFDFELNCYDENGQLILVIGYGWSQLEGKWFYKPTFAEENK